VVVTLGLWSLGFRAWALAAGIPDYVWPVTFGPAAKLDAFALGMALALLVAARPAWELDRGTRTLLWCTGAALLLWVFVGRDRGWYAPPHFHSLCGLAFLPILAPTVARGAAPGFSLLASAPLRWLGLVSYSLYLWHEPLLLVLGRRNLLISPEPADFPRNTLVLVGLALGMATLSYHLVERPALRLRAATERPAGSHAGA
jgi:peptidoglycan/LPS O-acetylase OafA/YrhL